MDFVYYLKAKRANEDLKLPSFLVSLMRIPERRSRIGIYHHYESLTPQEMEHLLEVLKVAFNFVVVLKIT